MIGEGKGDIVIDYLLDVKGVTPEDSGIVFEDVSRMNIDFNCLL